MGFEQLTQMGFIHEFMQVSEGPHSSKFCFVLGAGASKSSGIKMGQELVDLWEKELIERNNKDYMEWKEKLGITEDNKYGFYSQYYEKRYQKRPIDGLNFLEKMMEHVNPNVGYVVLSYLLTNTRHNVVITTNFDHLAEDAVNYYAQTLPLIIGHESLAHYITKQITRPTIIKIHRDLLFDPKNTVQDVEILHDAWKDSLNMIFSEYHPMFLGYAGNDNSLMDYLIENIEKFKTGEWKFPYWFLYQSEIPNRKVQKFLDGADGYCINCNGFDEVLCLLGAELGYKMPTEEEFFNDTRIRYRKLIDAFENILSYKTVSAKDGTQNSEIKVSPQTESLGQAMQKITSQRDFSSKYVTATTLHNQGNYTQALKLKRELVLEQPDNARYHNSLGITLCSLEMYEKAEEEQRKAVELEPDNAFYHSNLGDALYEQKKYKEAEEEQRKVIELDSNDPYYHSRLGDTLYRQKKYKEAESEKRRAIELDPDNVFNHYNLGHFLYEQKKYKEAEKEIRIAVGLVPKRAHYHFFLGEILQKQTKYKEAEEEIRKAIELDPDDDFYQSCLKNLFLEQ